MGDRPRKEEETADGISGRVEGEGEKNISEQGLEIKYALDILNRSQEAILLREAQLTAAVESLPFDFFGIDRTGRYFLQNEASRKIYGDFIGKRPEEVARDEDQLSLWLENNWRAFSGQVVKGEVEWMVGGEKRYFYNIIAPINSSGKIEGILGFNIDISDLRAATESIRQSEEKFRNIFDSINDSLFITDMRGRIIDVNRTAHECLGYTKEQILTMSIADIAAPDFARRVPERISRIKRDGKAVFESVHIRKDGTEMPVEVNSRIISYEGHRVFLSVVRDITDRKEIEKALQDSIVTARTLLDTPSAAAFLLDRQGTCVDANETFAGRFGRKISEIIGKSVWDLFPPEVSRSRRAYFDEVLRTKKQVCFEDEREGMWNDIAVTPILDEDGEVAKAVVFAFEITERKKIEKELEEYREHLEELVEQRAGEITALNDQLRQSQKLEAVGILAGGIAHEFNNILATMKGSMYLIQKKLPEDSPVMKYTEQVLASISKATTLSQGLLAFSRKQAISLRPLHINEIVRNLGNMLVRLMGEDIQLAMSLSDENPAVMADMNQIEQVLVNLATNARDAMPDGGTLTIETQAMMMDEDFEKKHGYGAPGEYAVLTVSDSGVGIEEKIRANIFEPFFTTKAVGKGAGLGLAVTYGIVKQHNGFIDVDSVPGRGTSFRIYFPKAAAEVVEVAERWCSGAAGGTETVLLAEDDEDTRKTMSEMLRLAGYNVLEARDGEEAVGLFVKNKEKVHLVFLDVRMPGKNGRVVYEEISSMYPQTRFLFTSGYTADIMDSPVVSDEGFNFISKTASPEDILRKIREVLDR